MVRNEINHLKIACNSEYPCTILVNVLKNSLLHTRHERLQDVSKCFARRWTKLGGEHPSLKLYYFFINVSCHPSPEVFNEVQVRWTQWMIRKTKLLAWKEILWPTSNVNCSIFQLKNLIFTQTSPFNEERWSF